MTIDSSRVFTLEDIKQAPDIFIQAIDSMSAERIAVYEEVFFRKRLPKGVRDALKKRKDSLKQNEKALGRLKKLFRQIYAIYWRIRFIHYQPQVKEYVWEHARSVGNDIYDLVKIWTGYESEESFLRRVKAKEQGHRYDPSPDHFWPRQWAGIDIMSLVLERKEELTLKELADKLHLFCHVHRVTSEENKLLMEHQKIGMFKTPEQAYNDAGIKLIKVSDYQDDIAFSELVKFLEDWEKRQDKPHKVINITVRVD